MFVGRQKEMALLEAEIKRNSSAVLIYGKRKIGKTTLIHKVCRNLPEKPFIYYECIKDTEEKNVAEILKIIRRLGLLSERVALPSNTFLDLFAYLNTLDRHIIVALDEYPYLKEFTSSKTIDSIFQNIIDNHLSNINLIISGSHIGMMKDLLEEKNALFGRFHLSISLKELSYLEASEFYPSLSNYDKVAFYSVFGGSPYVNEKISPNQSLKENIVRLLLDKDSPVYHYASSLLISDASNPIYANRLLSMIGNGRKSYSELEESLDKNKTGLLSKQLKPLLDLELIKKDAPINKMGDAKKTKYEINDNLLRFYYAYVAPNEYLFMYKDPSLIYTDEIELSITTFISYRFEDICRDFLWRFVNSSKMPGIQNIGRYYYDDPVHKKNGEFDVAVLHKDGSVIIIEAKYLNHKVNQTMIHKEISQIKQIKELRIDKVGFISIHGFEDGVEGLDYRFTGEDIYAWKK